MRLDARFGIRLFLFLLLVGLVECVPAPSASAGTLFWSEIDFTNGSVIRRSNTDGTGMADIVTGLEFPRGLAIDQAAGKIYWSDSFAVGGQPAGGKIQRANLDGSSVEDVLTGLHRPSDVELDLAAQKFYFADVGFPSTNTDGAIRRANLDGSGVELLLTTDPTPSPIGLALDPAGDQLFASLSGTNDRIIRSNLDGGAPVDLVTGIAGPQDIEIDVVGGKVYWGDFFADEFFRANLDGTGVEAILPSLGTGLALDLDGGKIYFTDSGAIRRANLDGSNVEDVITGLTRTSSWLAFLPDADVPEPATVTLIVVGLGLIRARRRR